ncbi:rhomboid-like protein [Streptomyces sp. NPDC017529]|uniref:rhomboid-like protein n=1 Tax=Streptomyces sp. NPDC017529 TaxID=3365000 RepID=UPI0037AF7DA7
MSRVATADTTSERTAAEGATSPDRACAQETTSLEGVPRQRSAAEPGESAPAAAPPAPLPDSEPVRTTASAPTPVSIRTLPRPWRLLPTPLGTPFTFGYTLLLVVTSLFAEHADPDLVHALLQASSTDVEHLAQAPLLVLVASALWIAGGMTSAYAIAFLFVLTALERRAGPLRTAAVFFGGHAVATLATEIPVGAAVALGHLPADSLQRLDYGISFGVMACTGALAGLLPAWARWPLLAGVGWFAVDNLLISADPVSDSGHLLALVLGVLAWPLLRRRRS